MAYETVIDLKTHEHDIRQQLCGYGVNITHVDAVIDRIRSLPELTHSALLGLFHEMVQEKFIGENAIDGLREFLAVIPD